MRKEVGDGGRLDIFLDLAKCINCINFWLREGRNRFCPSGIMRVAT